MIDIDFRQIVPRCGGQREAFEELSCQLAHRTVPSNAPFTRLRGAGGDGGVECFADLADGSRAGWQAKYLFDIGSLLTQTTRSLTTALAIHPTLNRFIVCFPFDLTGPTGRRGLSGQEKFDEWRINQEKNAVAEGRNLTIEAWPAFKLRQLLFQYDTSGGIREFFLNQEILGSEWFSKHLNAVKKTAGPRYTPELNVKTDLWKWLSAFGRTFLWSGQFKEKMRACRKAYGQLDCALYRSQPDPARPTWSDDVRKEAESLASDLFIVLNKCERLTAIDDHGAHKECVSLLDDILGRSASLESKLVADLEAKHGRGKADSPGFRQFMAEYMVSFPAANLDITRDAIASLQDLCDWLRSPACSLAFERVFVLSGVAGSGKTHGVCDTAVRRLSEDLLACVAFGHEFRGEPDPWTRLSETLGLPVTLGMNGLLDALNTAGEASGWPLILFVDAINETRPLRYWRDRLSSISQAVHSRPYVRLCVTCRTSFIQNCLPDGHGLPVVEHAGFTGVEREACRAFFRYYDLEPPIAPILQPELSNPLYLKLVCETLRARGLHRLPTGWHGLAPTIRAFLQEKEKQFATEYETSVGSKIVIGCLMAIIRKIADSGTSALTWSEAQRLITATRPQASTLPVLEWLVRADLLLEDAPLASGSFDDESAVRPAFERLGDFLIASELMERCKKTDLNVACQLGGVLYAFLKDTQVVEQNLGILAALSVLIPEQNSGCELPNLIDEKSIRDALERIAVESLPLRDPITFSDTSDLLIRSALARSDFSFDAMDAVLSISWQQSSIDAIWLDGLLKQKPLAERDAYWCGYLHDRYESSGIVQRLISAAFELPLEQLDNEIAERWSTVLLWFTAAADRRIKDWATRAATAILTSQTKVVVAILRRFIFCDDDEVRERALLSCYAALIISRDKETIHFATRMLQETYLHKPEAFDNALIRDHIRCISELARELRVLPEDCDAELTMRPIASKWPLQLPSEEQVESWGKLMHFMPDEFLSDFYKYSMYCLRPWEDTFSKEDMGRWILQRAARDFGYEGSGCERYDNYMRGRHGGGRGKPTWAERIGKKYQWLGMYQLASRLQDHVERKHDSWEPKPLRMPLILMDERKLDPTLPLNIAEREPHAVTWWLTTSASLGSDEALSDEKWVARQEDIPALENLLSVVEHEGQNWRLLVSYPSWGRRAADADWDDPYRQVWMHIESYLVRKQDFNAAYNCLHRRNFFGQWMPQGATWSHGFVGEYPWAPPFNTSPEEWNSRGRWRGNLPVVYQPSWNEIAVEWEYDASLPRNLTMIVPARAFFSTGDLWWDRKDGFHHISKKTVFRNPAVTESGPASLIVDADGLLERLKKLGLRLIWTLIGEKWILGGPHDKPTPRRTFSQIASLNEDGSLCIGERVFFEDYDLDTGPVIENKRTERSAPTKRKKRSTTPSRSKP